MTNKSINELMAEVRVYHFMAIDAQEQLRVVGCQLTSKNEPIIFDDEKIAWYERQLRNKLGVELGD